MSAVQTEGKVIGPRTADFRRDGKRNEESVKNGEDRYKKGWSNLFSSRDRDQGSVEALR